MTSPYKLHIQRSDLLVDSTNTALFLFTLVYLFHINTSGEFLPLDDSYANLFFAFTSEWSSDFSVLDSTVDLQWKK